MKTLILITRWLIFLPLVIVLLCIVWYGFGLASVIFPWWGMLILFLVSITPLYAVTVWPLLLAPNRKIGAVISAVTLIALEIIQFSLVWNEWPTEVLAWRIIVDLKILKDLYAGYHLMDLIVKDSFLNENESKSTEKLIEKTATLCAAWDDLPTNEQKFTEVLVTKFGENSRNYSHEIFERSWELFLEDMEREKHKLRKEAFADGNSELLETLDKLELKFADQELDIKVENSSLQELCVMRDSAIEALVEHLAGPYGKASWNLPLIEQEEAFTKIFISDHGEDFRHLAPAVLKRAWEIADEDSQKTGILYS